MRSPRPARRAGFTLVELAVSLAILAGLMGFLTVHLHQEARGMRELQALSNQERVVNELLAKVESHLDFAQGVVPAASLASALPANEDFVVDVDETDGFPDLGILLIDAGTAQEERVRYGDLDPAAGALLELERGAQGGAARAHASGAPVLWAGAATALEDQLAPAAGTFDGRSRELLGDVFYRGDGTGFSYRVPVDPAGGTDFLTAVGVRWGATIGGTPTEDGRACIHFAPVAVVTEADRAFDFNRDGDLDDTFDVGQLRQRAWNAIDDAATSSDVALCPPIILQERDAWGSDLDADGFEDPIFLWTPRSSRLRVRLFAIVGAVHSTQVVKQFETVLHLRNGAAE